jgi:hypothetical protein
MTADELIAQFRSDADDRAEPYLASNADVLTWLDEGQEEACIRAKLIYESVRANVCNIAVVAGTSVYSVHASVLDVVKASFTPTGSTSPVDLILSDRIELDRIKSGWRYAVEAPQYLVQDDTKVQFGCIPSDSGTLAIECYRLPLSKIEDADTPEIGRAHHRHLVQWALFRAFGRPDAELFDAARSEKALAAFERMFGKHPDANLRRSYSANTPMHNKATW